MKRTLPLVAALAVAALTLTACDSTTEADGYSIGTVRIQAHPSLDASLDGFKAALADAGLEVTFDDKNANGDQSIAASIAGTFASADHDLVLAIATPTAIAVAQAVTDTPVLFTAVTDPLDAGLVAASAAPASDAPGANVTGTSDANPVREQLELILEFVPDAGSLGVIYSPGEPNSVVQVNWVKEAAAELGLEVVEATAVTTADVQQAADTLDVDAIYVPTDNTVVSALDAVIQVGETKQIPVFAAEGDSVAKGTVATVGISYYDLGYQTGEMAVRILTEDADPATMAVETQSDLLVYVNLGAAERMGVAVPQSVLDRATADTTTE